MLQKFAAANGNGLIRAGNGAHTLREKDYSPTFFEDARNRTDGVKVGYEVALGDYLHEPENKRKVRTEKLVVARNKAERVRKKCKPSVKIIKP